MDVTQKKQLINLLLEKFAATVNADGSEKIRHVELFSGIKPSGYYLPNVRNGNIPQATEKAWYVEIWVNHECAYRYGESAGPEVESGLLDKLLADTFTCGLWHFHTEAEPENLNDRIFKSGAEILQLFWVAGQQEGREYGAFVDEMSSSDFRAMMPEIANHVAFPKYAKNQEWQSAMLDFGKLGLIAECSYKDQIFYVYGENQKELLTKIESRIKK